MTADGYYLIPPPLPHAPPPEDKAHELRAKLKLLSHEQLLDRALAAELRLHEWKTATSELVTSLALTPELTEGFYSRTLRELLSAGLLPLESVDELRHVECSMPCVAGEKPEVCLIRWCGVQYSEWDIKFSPASWWVSVSAIGTRWGMSFNCLTNVTDIRIDGVFRVAFADDLTALRVSFRERPRIEMKVESSVGWGVVPLPVREQIEGMVREEMEGFVERKLMGDESMVVVLRRKAVARLSDTDIVEAKMQAERAASVNLRSPTLL